MLELLTFENAIALVTLTALEVILGIDNIVMIAVTTAKLPEHQRPIATRVGLALALLMRIVLLFAIVWIMKLESTLFTILSNEISGRDILLIGGGLFLIAKATSEIHEKMEGPRSHKDKSPAPSFSIAIGQIVAFDLIFSLDSVVTAVGMVDHVPIMIAAVVIAIGVMMIFATRISAFVHRRPTIQVLALAFLVLIGVLLVADGLEQHLNRGYVYTAMGFALVVELINMRVRAASERKRSSGVS